MTARKVGDCGDTTTITVEDNGTAVDLAAYGTRKLLIRRPDGTSETRDAVLVGDGSAGQVSYTWVASDRTVAGQYRLQGYFYASATSLFYTSEFTRWVDDKLMTPT